MAVAFVTLWCGPAAGQQAELPLAGAREAYTSMASAWSALQQQLPGSLMKLPPAEAAVKVQAAEEARVALSRARLNYLESLRSACSAASARSRMPGGSKSEARDSLIKADQELLSDLDPAIAQLDGAIKAAARADRQRAAALQNQKTELLELKNLILGRGRELDRFGSELAQASATRQTLSLAYDQLASWTASAIEAAAKDDALWTAAYARMRKRLASQVPERPARSQAPVRSPDPAPPPAALTQAASSVAVAGGGAILVPNISGRWTLDNPNARRLASGAYEPSRASLDIRQTGNEVQGSFECTFAVPANESRNPVVRFNFSGRITNPILRFDILAPLKGNILIRQAVAGAVELTYSIDNAKKSGILVAMTPESRPIVLRKALR